MKETRRKVRWREERRDGGGGKVSAVLRERNIKSSCRTNVINDGREASPATPSERASLWGGKRV